MGFHTVCTLFRSMVHLFLQMNLPDGLSFSLNLCNLKGGFFTLFHGLMVYADVY